MNTFEIIQQYYKHRGLATREIKKSNGKVAGYFCNVPEELIIAAGFLPLRLAGDPWDNTETVDKYVEPFYEPDVRSTLNMLLTGRYDYLDYLIIPHSTDSVFKTYYHLQNIKKIVYSCVRN